MNQKAIEQAKDRDLASSFDAIRRAAKRARQVTPRPAQPWSSGMASRSTG